MPWRPSARSTPDDAPSPVPDSDAVRRAALAASWQRDRRIARRRLTWRWAVWYVQRYFLHVLGVLVLVLLLSWLIRSRLPASGQNQPDTQVPILMTPSTAVELPRQPPTSPDTANPSLINENRLHSKEP